MSDYSQTTDFTAKDAINAVFYGAHHDAEFNAIATAVATKANKVTSPVSGNIVRQDSNGDIQDSGVAASQVTTNATNIATNTSTISSHAASISTNATDIAALQAGTGQAAMLLGTPESVGTGTSKTAALSGTVEEVVVTLRNVSTDSTGYVRVRLGSSATLQSSGYNVAMLYDPGGGYDTLNSTIGFFAGYYTAAANNVIGTITFRRLISNSWLGVGSFTIDNDQVNAVQVGVVTLSGALDIVGIVAATGNFDSGTWSVDYRRSA